MQTEPGLLVYHFGADLFYANENRFTDEVRDLIAHAPAPVQWLVVDAGAITAIDYSAARAVHDLFDDLRSVRASKSSSGASMRTCAPTWTGTASPLSLGAGRLFATLHEAIDLRKGQSDQRSRARSERSCASSASIRSR